MNFDQFTQRINQIGRDLSQPAEMAVKVAGPIVEQIKAAAPQATGALKASIQMRIENEYEFYLEMLAYGFFQNYGVKASPDSETEYNTRQYGVEPQVAGVLPPSGGNNFQFGSVSSSPNAWGAFYSGLNGQQFFTMANLSNQITAAMQREINNRL